MGIFTVADSLTHLVECVNKYSVDSILRTFRKMGEGVWFVWIYLDILTPMCSHIRLISHREHRGLTGRQTF